LKTDVFKSGRTKSLTCQAFFWRYFNYFRLLSDYYAQGRGGLLWWAQRETASQIADGVGRTPQGTSPSSVHHAWLRL